ncbi:hypothetical protein BJX76DRAFT_21452 [Aspergillus varians]
MFQINRDLAARGIEWAPRRLYFLEAWNYPNVGCATSWNFRSGFLDELQLEEWLNQTGEFSIPTPPPGVGAIDGGMRLLACDYTLFQKASVRMSYEAFQLVESRFHLHPATLPSLEVSTGTFSKHFGNDAHQSNRISIILKAPQKFEIGNHMLSLTHDVGSRWTTAFLAGESIVDSAIYVQDTLPLPFGHLSPCAVIRAYLMPSAGLWRHPFTLPCIILTNHLRRLQQFCTADLTPSVMYIEEKLGVTRVGRRSSKSMFAGSRGMSGSAGRPVERPQAENLTVNINTELTRVRFTSHNPKWNYEASALLISTLTEITRPGQELASCNTEIVGMLEHNINLARSVEDLVLGLQKRLELQLNVLYSFVAQTDNRLSARLAATAGRDSTSMKILAFITTIFLPGSYVATLFSMNMFTWAGEASDADGSESTGPAVSSDFWIYWAVAAPLTAMTLGGWALWWAFEKHRYDEHLEDTVKSAGEVRAPPWWQRMLRSRGTSRSGTDDSPAVIQIADRATGRVRAVRHKEETPYRGRPPIDGHPVRRVSRSG